MTSARLLRKMTIGLVLTLSLMSFLGCRLNDDSLHGSFDDIDADSPTPPTSSVSLITDEGTTCLLIDGGLICWGENNHYEKLDGTTDDFLTPSPLSGLSSGVTSYENGFDFACAVVNGGVKCWGSNGVGQLGDGSTTQSTTPVSVIGLSSGVTKVVAGQRHACALLDDGGVKCWGDNSSGELGRGFKDGAGGYRETADYVTGLTSGVSDIFAGPVKSEHTCAIISGGVKCWGYNSFGQLGDGTTTSKDVPTDVTGLGVPGSGVLEVAASRYSSCALLDTGIVNCWGHNDFGQLGNNNLGTHSQVPVVVDLSALQPGEEVVSVGMGEDQACLLTDLGAVFCWGRRNHGQLGDGVLVGASVPVPTLSQITSGAVSLAVGRYHSCVLTSSDALKCWGVNNFGQLGLGHTTKQAFPQNVTY